MMDNTGVYKIINIVNKKIYVGSTSLSFRYRKRDHFSTLRRNVHANSLLQNAFNKYGEDSFIFEIIEICEPIFCIEKEQYWIDKLNVCDKSIGYNLVSVAGSTLGFKYSLKQRKNISEGLNRYKKSVIQLSLFGKFIKEYESIKQAARVNKYQSKVLSECCNGKAIQGYGYIWVFKKNFDINKDYTVDVNNSRINKYYINQYSLDKIFIKRWNSVKEIHKELGFGESAIRGCLNKYSKTSCKFLWEKEFYIN